MRTLSFRTLLFLGLVCVLPAKAMPPFTCPRLLQWADDNVRSGIPKAERVYILGPDEGQGVSGGPDGTPMLLIPVKNRQAVQFTSGMTLADLLRQGPIDLKKLSGANVYRLGGARDYEPVFTAKGPDWTAARFALHPRDIVHLFHIDPNAPLRSNN